MAYSFTTGRAARIPGIDREKFAEIAADAKANCPVPRVLNTKITLDAKLEAAQVMAGSFAARP